MTATRQDAAPAYSIDPDGEVEVNAAGAALLKQYSLISDQFRKLQSNWARAVIASLFVRHPSVLALDLHLSSSWEYDDAGGGYLSGSCTVSDVHLDPACPQVAEFLEEGEPDADVAADVLEEDLRDISHDLALALLGEDGSDDCRETFQRQETLALFGLNSSESTSPATAEPIPSL